MAVYYLQGEADPDNNELIKEFYIQGQPPNRPTRSNVPLDGLIRNQTYDFCTQATDSDSDSLRYKFVYRPSDKQQWKRLYDFDAGPVCDPNSGCRKGFEDSNCVSFRASADFGWPGEQFVVKAQAIDADGDYSEWSEEALFYIRENSAPSLPNITGYSQGLVGSSLSFKFWG